MTVNISKTDGSIETFNVNGNTMAIIVSLEQIAIQLNQSHEQLKVLTESVWRLEHKK